ncbi:hypothetical protein FOMA001_g18526 [Fusarium oxysporum f. sp. matthiolae]|nr:hypothetical protein FOMA001_g18526 [Fusarium oxysporum f. sp. matthiolae]
MNLVRRNYLFPIYSRIFPFASSGVMPKRACDSCKQRKVKCDQLSPTCTPCQLSELSCTYLVPRRKRGPKPKPRSPEVQALSEGHLLVHTPSTYQSASRYSPVPFESSVSYTSDNIRYSTVEAVVVGKETLALPLACHQKLLVAIALKTGDSDPDKLVDRCIDLYLGKYFPLVPVVCERVLRSHKSLVLPPFVAGTLSPHDDLTLEMLETIRIYSLLTVLCALIIRSDLLPESDTLATLFLQASETMLRLYLSQDIAAPSSTSLSIRILQAACHHFVGTPNLAWHSIDEAVRLTLQMRLYDEHSYEHLEPIEAKLCRNSFWHLYASDRSASLLNSRPLQLDKFHLEVSFTALEHLDKLPPLLDQTRLEHQGVFEDLLMQGFRKDHEVWDLGQAVLSDLRLFLATNNRAGERADMTPGQERALSELYLRFLSIVDDFPTHIASPATFHATDENITEYQRRAFWVQNANIMITYHYLRMKILDRFIDAELPHLLGVSSSPLSLAWKKVEIGHDLFCVLTGVPFEALQSNGEPCVEKLRYVCATLLEVMQSHESSLVVNRAKTHFDVLLDYLSRLNSRVSERLAATYQLS